EISVSKIVVAPVIDGKLTDAAWKTAMQTGDFVQADGNKTVEQKTSAYICYDDNKLYIAFKCFDTGLKDLVAEQTERDGPLWEDDSVEVFLDPTAEQKDFYHIIINQEGIIYDQIVIGRCIFNNNWNCNFEVKTSVENDGWVVEMAIPFSNFIFNSKDSFRLNLFRAKAEPYESTCWSPTYGSPHNPARFGVLKGIQLQNKVTARDFSFGRNYILSDKVETEIENAGNEDKTLTAKLEIIDSEKNSVKSDKQIVIKENSREKVSMDYQLKKDGQYVLKFTVEDPATKIKVYDRAQEFYITPRPDFNQFDSELLTSMKKSEIPIIDAHSHINPDSADTLVKGMDKVGIKMMVDLGKGSSYEKQLIKIEEFKKKYPGRFISFVRIDFKNIEEPDFAEKTIKFLDEAVKKGALGVKIHQAAFMTRKDKAGKRIPMDDARIDPVWAKIGQLCIPILIHAGDPDSFWRKGGVHDKSGVPEKEALMRELENIVSKNPKTIFISAHMGDKPENLVYLYYMLDTYPNYYIDSSARLGEMSQFPNVQELKDFFVKYQDRILYGTDQEDGQDADEMVVFQNRFRLFYETSTRNIPLALYNDAEGKYYYGKGCWLADGLALPKEVLEKMYYKNAMKLIFRK
ncbi:MAG: hypothetical protein A3J83_01200, partial [Elusimicrobia bacterium RIFOXYA2_FULL_40_6]